MRAKYALALILVLQGKVHVHYVWIGFLFILSASPGLLKMFYFLSARLKFQLHVLGGFVSAKKKLYKKKKAIVRLSGSNGTTNIF